MEAGTNIIGPMLRRRSMVLLLAAALAGAAACRSGPAWRTRSLFVFDTACQVRLYAGSGKFHKAEGKVIDIFREVQAKFSPEADDLSSPLVLELFRRARRVSEDSGGAFDVTVKPLSRLWGFSHNSTYVPTAEELAQALRLVGQDRVRDEGSRLVLPAGMGFDWGGIAKGLAVDRAARELKAQGITRGFINAGGDLYCWGLNPEGRPWQVGVRHPRTDGLLGVLSLSESGAATSGDYQRYFEVEGVRYHHIFDPKTGLPARGKRSVTVVGPETVVCDALSTALFVSPAPERILEKYPAYGAILVDDRGLLSVLGRPLDFTPER
jgi:thiamine biosynthesis lipoprotein